MIIISNHNIQKMNLVYSCCFYQEKYIELVKLLLKTYKKYGKPDQNTKYLIITNIEFKDKIQQIFVDFNIRGNVWCIDLNTLFEAAYARLKLFEYPNINQYEKILYLDCDILVTNNLSNIVDVSVENKLYVLKDGNTNDKHHGLGIFRENENPNSEAFTSGIMYFNNCKEIRKLFSDIMKDIELYIDAGNPIPCCCEQPFIIRQAFLQNMFNNTLLIGKVINNPTVFQNETISHFPGGVGHYSSKIEKMTDFLTNF